MADKDTNKDTNNVSEEVKASNKQLNDRVITQARMKNLASALEITNFAAFSTGLYDGVEQGFQLTTGLTYNCLDAQWQYDMTVEMVSNRRSKGQLVSLDCWLLQN